MNKEVSKHLTMETLTIMGIIAFCTLVFRFWPLLVIELIVILICSIRLLFLKAKKAMSKKATDAKPEEAKNTPSEKDIRDLAYSVILTRITELVSYDYPKAKWVWEKPNVRKLIENGEEVFILLSGAGGYRKAKVNIQNLQLVGLDYVTVEHLAKPEGETAEENEDEPEKNIDPIPVNYGLLAFEWVEAHIMDLNDRINDAIAHGKTEYVISEEELPTRESWSAIAEELGRQDIKNIVEDPHGIKIEFKQ